MRFHISRRKSGKSVIVLGRYLEEPENTKIIVHNRSEADRLKKFLADCGVKEPDVVIPGELDARLGKGKRVLVDNLDLVLPIWLGQIDLVTATDERMERKQFEEATPQISTESE